MRVLNPNNGTLQRLSKNHTQRVSYVVDRAGVAAFNFQQRLTTKERKRKFKHPSQ